MTPKPVTLHASQRASFRAMLFCMTPKQNFINDHLAFSFRAMLFCMTPKPAIRRLNAMDTVLELCCFV